MTCKDVQQQLMQSHAEPDTVLATHLASCAECRSFSQALAALEHTAAGPEPRPELDAAVLAHARRRRLQPQDRSRGFSAHVGWRLLPSRRALASVAACLMFAAAVWYLGGRDPVEGASAPAVARVTTPEAAPEWGDPITELLIAALESELDLFESGGSSVGDSAAEVPAARPTFERAILELEADLFFESEGPETETQPLGEFGDPALGARA